ncbi:hypothetical protein IAU59_000144 [Kwoniella sp. CBS 9459]
MADSAAELRRVHLEPSAEDDDGDSSHAGYASSDAESAPTDEDPNTDPEYEVDAIKWAHYRDSRFDRLEGAKGWHYGVMWRGYLKTASETEERLDQFLDEQGKAPMVREFWEAVAKTNPSKKPGPRKLEPKGYIGERIEVPKDLLKKWFRDIKKIRHKRDVATYFRRREKELELERRTALGKSTDDLTITKSDSDYYWNKKYRKERKKRRAQDAKEAEARKAAQASSSVVASTSSTSAAAPAPATAPAAVAVNTPLHAPPSAIQAPAIATPIATEPGSPGIPPLPTDSFAPNSPASTLGSLFNSDQEDADVDMVLDMSEEEQEQIEARPPAPSTSAALSASRLPSASGPSSAIVASQSPSAAPVATDGNKRKLSGPSDALRAQPMPSVKKAKKIKKIEKETAPAPSVEQNPVKRALNLIGLGKIPKRAPSPPPATATTPANSFGSLQPGIFDSAPATATSQISAISPQPIPSPALSGSNSPAPAASAPPRPAAPPDPRLAARATAIVQSVQGAKSPLAESTPKIPEAVLPRPNPPVPTPRVPPAPSTDGAPLPNFKPAPIMPTKLPTRKFEQPKRIQIIDNVADDEHSASKLMRLGIQVGPASLPARPTSSAFVPRGAPPPTGPRAQPLSNQTVAFRADKPVPIGPRNLKLDGNMSPNAPQLPGHLSPNDHSNGNASPLINVASPKLSSGPLVPQYQAAKDPRRKAAHVINTVASAIEAPPSLPTPLSASGSPVAHSLVLKPVNTTGGLVTFSPSLVLRQPARLDQIRNLISGNPDWGAYILPAVVKFLDESWGNKILCPEPGESYPVLAAFLPFDEPIQSISGLRPGGGLAISCCPPSPYDPACVTWKDWVHKLNTTSDYPTLSSLCQEYLKNNPSKEAPHGPTANLRAIEQLQMNDLRAMKGRSDIINYTRRIFVIGDERIDPVDCVEVVTTDEFVMLVQSQAKL